MNADERKTLEELLRAYGQGEETTSSVLARFANVEADPAPFEVLEDLVLAGEVPMQLASVLYDCMALGTDGDPAALAPSREHRWVAVCAARFTEEQADVWARRGDSGLVDTSFSLVITDVICAECGSPYGGHPRECSRPESASGHRWTATAKVAMTEDEATDWVEDEIPPAGIPQVTQVVCTLCGRTRDDASEVCEDPRYTGPVGEAA